MNYSTIHTFDDTKLVKTICTLISIVLNEFILFPDQTLIVGSKTA